jgi:hypothetical protein
MQRRRSQLLAIQGGMQRRRGQLLAIQGGMQRRRSQLLAIQGGMQRAKESIIGYPGWHAETKESIIGYPGRHAEAAGAAAVTHMVGRSGQLLFALFLIARTFSSYLCTGKLVRCSYSTSDPAGQTRPTKRQTGGFSCSLGILHGGLGKNVGYL